jgi:hypothetical protein
MSSPERRLAIAICLALAAFGPACAEVFALPAGSESFDPPAEYQLWWSMTESCSGLRGSLSDIDWFVVPGVETLPESQNQYAGEWFEHGNRIVLAGNSEFDGGLVRHEMLHALVRASNHPRMQFLERCAGYVFCASECTRDAEPAPVPPVGTPVVSPNTLEIGIELQPAPVNPSNFGGYFTFIVTAHNPANHAVITDLSPPPGNRGISFSYVLITDAHLLTGSNFTVAYDSEETYFRAGETKRAVFDLFVGEYLRGGLGPGSYTAYGYFGNAISSSPTMFVISP